MLISSSATLFCSRSMQNGTSLRVTISDGCSAGSRKWRIISIIDYLLDNNVMYMLTFLRYYCEWKNVSDLFYVNLKNIDCIYESYVT